MPATTLGEATDAASRAAILRALATARGNRAETAETLGISVDTLRREIVRLSLVEEVERRAARLGWETRTTRATEAARASRAAIRERA